MTDRKPSIEERFLGELGDLLTDDDAGERTTMLARFVEKSDTGGPTGSDLQKGVVIPKRSAVMAYLWPTDASAGDKPALIAHMVSEPEGAWTDLPQPASVVVRGRIGKGAALIITLEEGRLRSLHPAVTRRFRSPRLGV